MKRLTILAAVLVLLLGVDIMANDASITRDIFQALAHIGNRVVRTVDSMVSYMVGRR